jgi:hypothetical protein
VRGRGAICRDLSQDLRRIKALGVGCIIWYAIDLLPEAAQLTVFSCLDDEELNFLGAPWPEYSQASRELGIDILRWVLPLSQGCVLSQRIH